MHGKEKGPLKISVEKSYRKRPFNDTMDLKEMKCYISVKKSYGKYPFNYKMDLKDMKG
jgi:hypothetical protein